MASAGFLTIGAGLGSGTLTAGFSGGFCSTGFGVTTEAGGPADAGPGAAKETRLTLQVDTDSVNQTPA